MNYGLIFITIYVFQGAGYLKRANTERLHEVFDKYASKDINGEKFMTSSDFVRNYLQLFNTKDYNVESMQLLASIVDSNKDGHISFAEFQAFEGLLCVPDALYKTAFQLFDTNGNGMVTFGKSYTHLTNIFYCRSYGLMRY